MIFGFEYLKFNYPNFRFVMFEDLLNFVLRKNQTNLQQTWLKYK